MIVKSFVDKVKTKMTHEYLSELISPFIGKDFSTIEDFKGCNIFTLNNISEANRTNIVGEDRKQFYKKVLTDASLNGVNSASLLASVNSVNNNVRFDLNYINTEKVKEKVNHCFILSVAGRSLYNVLTKIYDQATLKKLNLCIDIPDAGKQNFGYCDSIRIYASNEELAGILEILNDLQDSITFGPTMNLLPEYYPGIAYESVIGDNKINYSSFISDILESTIVEVKNELGETVSSLELGKEIVERAFFNLRTNGVSNINMFINKELEEQLSGMYGVEFEKNSDLILEVNISPTEITYESETLDKTSEELASNNEVSSNEEVIQTGVEEILVEALLSENNQTVEKSEVIDPEEYANEKLFQYLVDHRQLEPRTPEEEKERLNSLYEEVTGEKLITEDPTVSTNSEDNGSLADEDVFNRARLDLIAHNAFTAGNIDMTNFDQSLFYQGEVPEITPLESELLPSEEAESAILSEGDLEQTTHYDYSLPQKNYGIEDASGLLTQEELHALAAITAPLETQEVNEEEKEFDISKYSFISTNPDDFLVEINDAYGNHVTLYEYLEQNDVLNKIPLDSSVRVEDEVTTAQDFIKNDLVKFLLNNGYMAVDDYIEMYNIEIKNSKQKKKGFLNKLFGGH